MSMRVRESNEKITSLATRAKKSGLALANFNEEDGTKMYVLYDPVDFLEMLDELKSQLDDDDEYVYDKLVKLNMADSVYAMACINKKIPGRQWNASSIRNTAAIGGYGPLIYDIAMAFEHGLLPDRTSVSAGARNVWAKYAQRSDVEKRPLDDERRPKTPPKIDDAPRLHNDPGEEFLDYAYFVEDTPNISALQKNNESVKTAFMNNAHISSADFYSLMDGWAFRMFLNNY